MTLGGKGAVPNTGLGSKGKSKFVKSSPISEDTELANVVKNYVVSGVDDISPEFILSNKLCA